MVQEARTHDVMTNHVEVLRESNTLEEAALVLAECGIGALLVCDEDNRITGILTDRDIVVSGIAMGKDPQTTTIGEIATFDPICVTPDMPVKGVAEVMARHRVRRLPVVEKGGAIVGIVSQGDVARAVEPERIGRMLSAIST